MRIMQLYQAERHERLTETAWNKDRARDAIDRIVTDTNRSFSAESLWPIHPTDRSPERPPDSIKYLYHGAAGVIWALDYLNETGATAVKRDYLPTVRQLIPRIRVDLDKYPEVRKYMGAEVASYLLGEAGILLLEWQLAPSEDVARRLYGHCEARIGDPRGLAWGGAGAMLAALFMYERTDDARWRELYIRSFQPLWDKWSYSDEARCHLWTSSLYGVTEMRIGAIHGFAANAFVLIRGRHFLAPDRAEEILRQIQETVHATALIEGSQANWPNNVGPTTRPAPLAIVVQHCNGAPGIINCLAEFPNDARWPIDTLLLRAGDLIWEAGPPVKFPSLCHGAAGSGYAFLKLYARTGDRRWLERACRFAMHAIDQCDSAVKKYGQRKFSLWTGDLGVAIYLWDCIRATAKFPTLDVF
jgi:Lanthionine synthetase C-like protein